jgi:anti-sigma factor (TIGR02949 family)
VTCKDAIDRLCDYLDAELRPGDIAEFEAHLARCTPCRRYLATYQKARELAAKVNRVAMPETLRTRLRLLLAGCDARRDG